MKLLLKWILYFLPFLAICLTQFPLSIFLASSWYKKWKLRCTRACEIKKILWTKRTIEEKMINCHFKRRYQMVITELCTYFHPAPSTSTQLHPAPSTSTQLQPPPPSSFQFLPSALQYPQQYSNENIARNWAISPNLGQKIQSCPIWLKIGSHDILEVFIPNPDLDLWNSDLKIHFWANLGPKS